MKKLFIIFGLTLLFVPFFVSAVALTPPGGNTGSTANCNLPGYFSPSGYAPNQDCTKIPTCPLNSTSIESFNYTTQKYQYTCPCNAGYQFNSQTALCDAITAPILASTPTCSCNQTEINDIEARLTKLETGGNANNLDSRITALEAKYSALSSFVASAFSQILQALTKLVK